MKIQKIITRVRVSKTRLLIIAAALLIPTMWILPETFALTYLTHSSVILTNMNAGGASSIIVEFTTSSTNTGTNGSLVFSGWTGTGGTGTVATSQAVSQTYNSVNCTAITGATANLPGSPTAAGTAGSGTITLTDATALVASTSYCYVLTSGITANPTATGQTSVALTAGSDSATSDAIDIISNDQVIVSAIVPPSFTLALSGNTDSFTSNLSGTVTGTTGVTATVNTNAKTGWALYGSDSNTGLKSTTQNYTIPSTSVGTNTTLSANVEGYVTGLPAGGITQGSGAGVTSATTAYASSGTGNGSGLTTTTPEKLASSTGTANGAIVTVKEFAAVSPTTPAASDYSDTITLVGAGSF